MPIPEGKYTVPAIGRFRAWRASGFHKGLDQYGPKGTPSVFAARARVLRISFNPDTTSGFGHSVAYRHEHDGAEVIEAHFMARPKLVVGEVYSPGATVGLLGDSGNALRVGPHVHVEVRNRAGVLLDPTPYFRKLGPGLTETPSQGHAIAERRRRTWLL